MTKYVVLFFCIIFIRTPNAQTVHNQVKAAITKAEIFRKKDKNYKKAIELLESLLEELEKEGKYEEIILSPLFHKLGVNYYKIGDYTKAEVYTAQALNIRLKKYGNIHKDVARGYFSMATINRKIYNYKIAKENIDQAIYSMETLINDKLSTDTLRLIKMYDEYIRLNRKLKNNFAALVYWEKSYRFYSRKKNKDSKIASLFSKKGSILMNQKKYTQAEKSYKKTVKIYTELNKENTNFEEELAGAYVDLALVQTKLNLFEMALTNNLKAINLFQERINKKNNPKFHQYLGNTYCNLVELSNKMNQFDTATMYFEKSSHHNLTGWETSYHSNFAELYRNKTQTHINKKNYIEALQANHKALQALLPTLNTEDPLQLVNLNKHPIKDKISFLETLQQRAEVFTLIYNQKGGKDIKYLKAAFQNYQTLDTVITQIRQGYAQGSQFELIEQSYSIYEKAIAAGIQLFEQTGEKSYVEAAYYFAAKNKALVLLSGRQEEDAKSFSSISLELLDKEKSLKRAIFQLESKLYEQGVSKDKTQLQDSLFTLRRAHQKLINRFEEEHADYYDAKYGFDKKIEIKTLQQQLLAGTCILEYFVGDEQIFIFTITSTGFDYVAIDKPLNFEQSAFSFRKKMESQTTLSDEFVMQSYQLYQWLLEEALNKVNKKGHITHLMIIPDGILMQLPFDVFLQEETGRNYVLRDYAVSYAYSNQLLFAKPKHKKAKYIFAGFGLAYDDYTLENLETYVNNPLANVPLSRALGELQYSTDEIIEISDLLNGNKWLNKAATREAFLENAGEYAILHLATHGIVNEEYPMNSALIFTRQNDSTEYFLRAADLYNMDLNADMAVLSACNTGAGTLQRGEGVRSLARAFSYAGCPSLIASLWSAADKSTKDILVDFYKNLKTGMTKDEAMRQAKLTYLDNAPPAYQSPYYWSHLSVIGDSSELEVLRSTPSWKKYAIEGVVGLLIIGIWGYRRRKMAA